MVRGTCLLAIVSTNPRFSVKKGLKATPSVSCHRSIGIIGHDRSIVNRTCAVIRAGSGPAMTRASPQIPRPPLAPAPVPRPTHPAARSTPRPLSVRPPSARARGVAEATAAARSREALTNASRAKRAASPTIQRRVCCQRRIHDRPSAQRILQDEGRTAICGRANNADVEASLARHRERRFRASRAVQQAPDEHRRGIRQRGHYARSVRRGENDASASHLGSRELSRRVPVVEPLRRQPPAFTAKQVVRQLLLQRAGAFDARLQAPRAKPGARAA